MTNSPRKATQARAKKDEPVDVPAVDAPVDTEVSEENADTAQAPAEVADPDTDTGTDSTESTDQAIPATAQIDPPANPEPEAEYVPPTMLDAAAERVANSTDKPRFTTQDGEPVDPDTLFGESDSGIKTCQVRVLEHVTATVYERPMTRLFVAAGATLTDGSAAQIVEAIRASNEATKS